MKVKASIEDDDLDTRYPDPDEDDGDGPDALVHVLVGTSDGMRYGAVVHLVGGISPERLVEAIVSAAHGAARTHSPDAAAALQRWLVVPDELDVEP